MTIKNCDFLGDHRSSTANGIIVSNGAAVQMEGCSLKNFASGISCGVGSKPTLTKCAITNCRVGLRFKDKCDLEFDCLKIKALRHAVIFKGTDLDPMEADKKTLYAPLLKI